MRLLECLSVPPWTALFCLVFLSSPALCRDTAGQQWVFVDENPPAAVVETSSDDAVIFGITEEDCSIEWVAFTSGPNKGVVKHRGRCPAPLSRQVAFLAGIVTEFLGKDKAPSFHTLFWGGLVPEQGAASLEMPLRLALTAYQSRGWDVDRGKPAAGDVNRFVKDLANKGAVYPELSALFRRFHRTISIRSIEKVRVLEAGKLPFYDELRKSRVRATDRLPFDCMVWFSISETIP